MSDIVAKGAHALTHVPGSAIADLSPYYVPRGPGTTSSSNPAPTLYAADYGVKADGSTDDRASWQAAVNQLDSIGGGRVIGPAGDTVLGSPGIVFPAGAAKAITVEGAGMGGVVTNAATSFIANASGYSMFKQTGGGAGPTLRNLCIGGGSSTPSVGVDLEGGVNGAMLESVQIGYCGQAILGKQLYNSRINNCLITTSGSGTATPAVLLTDVPGVDGTNSVWFIGTDFEANTGTDVRLDGSTTPCVGVILSGCKWERGSHYFVDFAHSSANRVIGGHMVSPAASCTGLIRDAGTLNTVNDTLIAGNTATLTYLVELLSGSGWFTLIGNTLQDATAAHIKIDAGVGYVTIGPNCHYVGAGEAMLTDSRALKTGTIIYPQGATFGDGGGNVNVNINGAAGGLNGLTLQSADSDRWKIRKTSTAESGGNAGSELEIRRLSDTGADLGSVVTMYRQDGGVVFNNNVEVIGKFSCNGVAPPARAANPGTATGTDAAVINAIATMLRNTGICN